MKPVCTNPKLILSGDISGMVPYALQAAHTLQTLSYSRNAEDQADEQGFLLLQQTGINPKGMLTFFAKLGKIQPRDTVFRYLSTHPATKDRLSHLEEFMPPGSMTYLTFPFQSDWSEITTLCDSPLKPGPHGIIRSKGVEKEGQAGE